MDFEFSEEQVMIRNMAKDFAEKEIAPIARDSNRNEHYPDDLVKKLGKISTTTQNEVLAVHRDVCRISARPFAFACPPEHLHRTQCVGHPDKSSGQCQGGSANEQSPLVLIFDPAATPAP